MKKQPYILPNPVHRVGQWGSLSQYSLGESLDTPRTECHVPSRANKHYMLDMYRSEIWEKAGVPGEKPSLHRENMQTQERKAPVGMWTQTSLHRIIYRGYPQINPRKKMLLLVLEYNTNYFKADNLFNIF